MELAGWLGAVVAVVVLSSVVGGRSPALLVAIGVGCAAIGVVGLVATVVLGLQFFDRCCGPDWIDAMWFGSLVAVPAGAVIVVLGLALAGARRSQRIG